MTSLQQVNKGEHMNLRKPYKTCRALQSKLAPSEKRSSALLREATTISAHLERSLVSNYKSLGRNRVEWYRNDRMCRWLFLVLVS
jgi:hypothetical protein